MRRRALITGLTGQDGTYLAELLLDRDYEVYGLMRRTSAGPSDLIENLHLDRGLHILHGDIRDVSAVTRAIEESQPDEIYNLAAQSHVGLSFKCPEETLEINYHGLGRIVIAAMERNPHVRIYQASTSEMFGSTPPPQNEESPFNPVSPYAEAKLRAHEDYVVGYRNRHNLFICSGILFNHESPRRGKQFVTRKVTYSLAKLKLGLQDRVELGNLSAKRDWGHARDYVQAMRLILAQDKPEDFVIATGIQHTVRELVSTAAAALDLSIRWEGEGENEVGLNADGQVIVAVNPEFYRPREVHDLLGDASKARNVLGWEPSISFEELIGEMTRADYDYLSAGQSRSISS